MAARRAACLVEPTHRVASRGGHDLPLSAREPLEAHRVARRGGSGWRLARLAGRRPADGALGRALRGPLPQDEFDWIFSRVPRLTVEVVMASSDRGVLLALRDFGPCKGLWHLPGGTVRFGEPVTGAVRRVALDELGLTVRWGAARLHRVPQPLQQRPRFTDRPGVPRAPSDRRDASRARSAIRMRLVHNPSRQRARRAEGVPRPASWPGLERGRRVMTYQSARPALSSARHALVGPGSAGRTSVRTGRR